MVELVVFVIMIMFFLFDEIMQKIDQFFEHWQQELLSCDTEREKYELLLDLGKELGDFPRDERVESNKVPGCVSEVYVAVEIDADGHVQIWAESGSLIVRGFCWLLVAGLSGRSAEEILASRELLANFALKTGIDAGMVASRANAFMNIYQKIFNLVNKYGK